MTKSLFAFIFPGQGSQHVGMLAELTSLYPIAKETFEQASDALGYDMLTLALTGPDEKLNQTEYTQPALLTASVAVYRVWKSLTNAQPQLMAGHSLGEYSALVCSGSLAFEDAVKLVQKRGQLMQAAVPEGEGAMAAIIGLDNAQVTAICDKAAQEQISPLRKLAAENQKQGASEHRAGVYTQVHEDSSTEATQLLTSAVEFSKRSIVAPANLNAIGQVVISGHRTAIERAIVLAKTQGAKIAKLIPVSVPSHCALMEPAARLFQTNLAQTTFLKPDCPVIHNVDVKSHNQPDGIKNALATQLYQPVRWVETIQTLKQQSIVRVIELGPGKVLTSLTKRIDDQIESLPVYDEASLQQALAHVAQ